MNVIITYASVGAGHFKAAEAIYNCLKKEHPRVDTQLVDILKKEGRLFRLCYTGGYTFLVKYAPFLWWIGFWLCDFKPLRPVTRSIATAVNWAASRSYARYLVRKNPDVVISTHFLTSEVTAHLKIRNRIKAKLVTVITDFGVHPFWISPGTDMYVVAAESTRQALAREGVELSRIRAFGIPVDPRFLEPYDRRSLRRKYSLKEDAFTVLIATGSFGIGPIEAAVDLLQEHAQVIVVCARNQDLYSRLVSRNYPHARIFGFVDNIPELMACADVIVTKPGGLSIVESLTMELTPVFIAPIPGQEKENIRILAAEGISLYARSVRAIKDAIVDFRDHPEKLRAARARIAAIRKPTAAQELCDALCSGRLWSAG